MSALPTLVTGHRQTLMRLLMDRAEQFGDKPLICFPRSGQALRYAELVTRARAGGARLAQDCKVQPGQVAATYLSNSPEVVEATFCSLFAGLIDAPINREYSKSLLAFSLAVIEAKIVYTDMDGVRNLLDGDVAAVLSKLQLIVLCGMYAPETLREIVGSAACPPILALAELTAPRASGRHWEAVDATNASIIRFTSGTTGPSKAILQSHLHVINRTGVHNFILDYGSDGVLYSPFPLHHTLAGVNGLFGTLLTGGTMVSVPRFSASQYWAEAKASGATVGHLLWSVVALVAAQPPSDVDRTHRVRWLWAGPPDGAFQERFNTRFVQCFGMSEVGTLAFKRVAFGSNGNGKPVEHMDVQILDELDRPVSMGTVGQICVRPREPHRVFIGYFNNAEATMRAFRNLWYHTGDTGHFGEDGELYFDGRIGDTIRRRGVNISSDQIESELRKSELVRDCGVIGVPSETGEEEIHACVIWGQSSTPEQSDYELLMAHLSERLPRDYVPRYLEIVENLPRTDTGKVRKLELKRRPHFGRTWDRVDKIWVHS